MIKMDISNLFKALRKRKERKEQLRKIREQIREEEKQEREEKSRLDQYLECNVKFFPGPVQDYQDFVGHNVRVINTWQDLYGLNYRMNLGIFFVMKEVGMTYIWPWYCIESLECKRNLVKKDVEALVNCQYLNFKNELYVCGLPVSETEFHRKIRRG